jgi:RNA recognition motif-containing protein
VRPQAKKKKRRTEQEPDGARDAAPVAPLTAEEVVAKAERTVFVGNLKAETTRKRLRHLFSSCVSLYMHTARTVAQ